MGNARKIAVTALCRVVEQSGYSNLVLGEVLSKDPLEPKDKALASALFYGVLDRKITLNYYLNKLSKTPVRKMQPITKAALWIGLYQILYMDKIPSSAAVNESVKIVKASKENKNSGFVNAVLRSAIRDLPKLPSGDTADVLSVRYSMPPQIISSLIKDYGINNAKATLKAFLQPAPLNIRVNTLKTDKETLKKSLEQLRVTVTDGEAENSICVLGGVDFSSNTLFKDGMFYVQDTASQLCAQMLNPQKGERILDVCAAPGGKSFTAAMLSNNSAEIIACDLYPHRADLISSGAKRLGITCITAKSNDACVYDESLGLFDAVLCDVPCSGWGVLRRKPEIKYKPIEDFSEIEDIGQKILKTSARYVKSGGRMVYSTCTLRKNENENQVNWFLENNKDFTLLDMQTDFPFSGNTDGFFRALFVRK